MTKKANCRCTLKGLVDLKLDDTKKNLMKNSQFYQFLNVKDKATASFLVHNFLQCYKAAEKHFVNQKVVTIDVSDIARMTEISPPTKEKKAEKKKKEEAMEERGREEKEEEEEEKGKGEALMP
ncbi:Stress response protein nst1 [Bienertia sinuspersici]